MLARLKLCGLSAVALGALAACGEAPVLSGAQSKVDDARARNDAPAIWRAVDEDSTLYLFGTVHLLPRGVIWNKADQREAFGRAGTVFFEADNSGLEAVRAEKLTSELGLRRDGRRLTDDLDNYQAKLLEAVANNGDIPLASLDAMQPWLATEYLTLSAALSAGLSADMSPDEALKSRARGAGKAIIYLETPTDQIRSVADLSLDTQLAILTDTMEQFDAMPAMLDRVARHWAVGDVPTLEQALVEPLADAPPDYVEAVLGARNEAWAEQLDRFMQGSGVGFAAVGVSHLIGEDNLVQDLKDRGYVVTRYFAFMGEDVITPTIAEIPDTPAATD
jgi:uncharacterized protein YbaP (TraB family)